MSIELENLALGSVAKGFAYAVTGCAAVTATLLSAAGVVQCFDRATTTCRATSNSYSSLALSAGKFSLLVGASVTGVVLGGAIAFNVTNICFRRAFQHLTRSSLFASSLPTILEGIREISKEVHKHTVYVHGI